MRGLKTLRLAQVVSAGHAFIQNVRRGHYELGIEARANKRLPAAFAELTLAIGMKFPCRCACLSSANATGPVSSTHQRFPTRCRHGRAASASNGVNRCTHRKMLTWSTLMPRWAKSHGRRVQSADISAQPR
jgi:hypothetical protein